jgi:hypothetical protein
MTRFDNRKRTHAIPSPELSKEEYIRDCYFRNELPEDKEI